MTDWISKARTEGAYWFKLATESSPQWVRLALAFGLGAMASVLLDLVDIKGDFLRIYTTVAGILVAAAASFLTGRLINEHNDRRLLRRRARLVELAMMGLYLEFNLMRSYTDKIPRGADINAVERDSILQILNAANRIERTAETVPDFTDLLNTAADTDRAESVLSTFRFASAGFSAAEDWQHAPIEANRIVANAYLSDVVRDQVASNMESLRAARAHFAQYL
jgi:hypothetical protein